MRPYHVEEGTGDPPLLLVHGWGGDHRVWAPIRLPGRVVAVDLRGHGNSPAPAPASGYRPADLAADLTELDLGPVVAVGHSMGAQVVTALAVEHPGRVAALVVVDPAYGADEAEEQLFAGRLAALRSQGAAAAVRQLGDLPDGVRDQLLATPGHVLAECYAGMYTTPEAFGTRRAAERYLARRRCPVLSLHSVADAASWGSRVPAAPGSETVHWPGTGHFLHLERPVAFADLVTRWLRRLGHR